ncbi:MAG TPA: hypothetical protein VFC00_31825 [Micromonosporaceae bacterium]|nr:hypothetical protein [Micromonosporaceae bacterium]
MDWPLWRRWTVSTTAGELLGFVAPALAGGGATAAALDAPTTYLLLLIAGSVEGLALGAAQGWALRKALPRLPPRDFALATGAAAVLAYAIGMLPSSLGDRLGAVPPAVLVLRRYGYGWPLWIVTTAGAWLAALLVFVAVSTPLWRPGQPVALTVAIGLLGAAAMAVTAAALTGFAAVRLTRRVARPTGSSLLLR